jgi:hypothetical protein
MQHIVTNAYQMIHCRPILFFRRHAAKTDTSVPLAVHLFKKVYFHATHEVARAIKKLYSIPCYVHSHRTYFRKASFTPVKSLENKNLKGLD